MKRTLPSPTLTLALVCSSLIVALSACSGERETQDVSGALSGVFSVDSVIEGSGPASDGARSAALLGVFVSEYLSLAPRATAAESALLGIGAQMQIALKQSTIDDPDYQLIQAFADALQVNVPDLLNRSVSRADTLDTYTEALTNVATRANDRFKELDSVLEQLNVQLRQERKDLSEAERAMNAAMREEDFSRAGELQKTVNDRKAIVAETELKEAQTQEVVDTLDRFLTLYSEKILAIQSNREVLIAGSKVVDVPGIEDLDVIERTKGSKRRRGSDGFDSLFEGRNTL